MNNLEIYNKYKSVPVEAQSTFDNGSFKGTDINTMWRIKSLTEAFGICGIGWYYDIVRTWTEKGQDDEVMAFAEIKLYIKVDGEWSKGISATGGSRLIRYNRKAGYYSGNDEAFKMCITDALGVATKLLGFGADIYWGQDRTKYSDSVNEKDEDDEIIGGAFILQGGKYNGKTIQEVAEKDEKYIRWCIENGKSGRVKLNMIKCLQDMGKTVEVSV